MAESFWERNEEALRTIQYEKSLFCSGYIAGATEQRKIDIDKACLIYHKELSEIIAIFNRIGEELYGISELGEFIYHEGSVKDFRKAMEGK